MTADLDDFFSSNGAQPWSWGAVDCCLALADWAVANGWPDLGVFYRGTYSDEEECRSIIIGRGGLLSLVSADCERIGMRSVVLPSRGAIGVIGSRANPLRQWGAIHDGTRWRVRSVNGFQPVTARAIGAWSV